MSRLYLYACLASLLVCQGVTSADPVTFAVGSVRRFGSLDLGTGDVTFIGGPHDGAYAGLGNLADGTLAAIDGLNDFVLIDGTTGDVTTIGPTGIVTEAFASLLTGELFATDDQNQLFQIDPDTGASTLVGSTGIAFTGFQANALAGNVTSLYYIWQSGTIPSTLYELDLTTGAATAIGPTGTTGLAGAGFADGTLYAYSTARQIFTIDLATGAATDTGVTHSPGFLIFGSNSGEAPEPGTRSGFVCCPTWRTVSAASALEVFHGVNEHVPGRFGG